MASPQREQMIANLNDCLTTLTHSLGAYILTSGAYVSDADKDALGAMQEIAANEKGFADRIFRLVIELGGITQVSVTDPDYAHLNFLSYPYLLDVVADHKREQIEIYKGLLESIGNYPEVRNLYRDVLAAHESHLATVEGIRENRYKTTEPEPEPEPEAADEASSGEPAAEVSAGADADAPQQASGDEQEATADA